MPNPMLLGADNNAGTDLTILESPLQLSGMTTVGTLAVTGQNPAWDGNPALTVNATTTGVHPMPQNALEVTAAGGVAITVTASDGVEWMDPEPVIGVGVTVSTQKGTALIASTETGQALVAATTDPLATKDAVTVSYAGTGRAVYAESTATSNGNATIAGVNDGHGIGVLGEHRNNAESGIGVVGVGAATGRGAQFTGGAAAMRMVPSAAATHPATGKVGDFVVDASGRLWFCQRASVGANPAVWKQIA